VQLMSPGTTILLVSSENTLSLRTVDYLQERRRRGSAITLVMVGDADADKEPLEQNLPAYHIGGKEKWRELIRTAGEESIGTSATFLKLD
jgi:hypothetical protein